MLDPNSKAICKCLKSKCGLGWVELSWVKLSGELIKKQHYNLTCLSDQMLAIEKLVGPT